VFQSHRGRPPSRTPWRRFRRTPRRRGMIQSPSTYRITLIPKRVPQYVIVYAVAGGGRRRRNRDEFRNSTVIPAPRSSPRTLRFGSLLIPSDRQVRGVEIGIVLLVLLVWVAAIVLFFNRWGKIRMLLPYQPDYKQEQLKVPGTAACAAAVASGNTCTHHSGDHLCQQVIIASRVHKLWILDGRSRLDSRTSPPPSVRVTQIAGEEGGARVVISRESTRPTKLLIEFAGIWTKRINGKVEMMHQS
jgi:hypothetical protein